MSKRRDRKTENKDKLSKCREQLNFFRGETIQLRKLLSKTATEQIQNLGSFQLVKDNGKKIPLKIKEDTEVKT